jgi:Immunity protein 35
VTTRLCVRNHLDGDVEKERRCLATPRMRGLAVAAMRSIKEAKQIALAHLATSGFADINLIVLDSHAQEFEAGSVFFYQSASYVETHDIRESLVTRPCLCRAPKSLPLSSAIICRSPSRSPRFFPVVTRMQVPLRRSCLRGGSEAR